MAVPNTEARVWFAPPTEADRFLPEGPRPVTVAGRPAIAWVNIQTATDADAGSVHLRFLDRDEHRELPLTGRPGMIFPTDRVDTLLVGMGKEIGLLNLGDNTWEPIARIPDDHTRTIINDGEIVPGGEAIVFGTKDVNFADPIAHLYLFTVADRRVTKLADGQTCSNGKAFGGSGVDLFDIDTPRKVIARHRVDVTARTLVADGVAVDLRDTPAFPDGMTDCRDGTVIVAFYNPDPVPAGRAARYRLDTGELVEEWSTPGSPRVTCPLLVQWDDGVKLLLTTAVEGMPDDQRGQAPNAGSLFIADTGIASMPPPEVVKWGTGG